MQKCHDSSNAFYCPNNQDMETWRRHTYGALGRAVEEQVVGNSIVVCNAAEGPMLMNIADGVASGLTCATNMFLSYV